MVLLLCYASDYRCYLVHSLPLYDWECCHIMHCCTRTLYPHQCIAMVLSANLNAACNAVHLAGYQVVLPNAVCATIHAVERVPVSQ